MTAEEAAGTVAAPDPTRHTPSVARSAASGGTFAIANAAQRALVFIMLPIYTAVLSPAAYGRLGLLITVQSGAVLLLQGGMEASITRQYFGLEKDRSGQDRFVQSAWRLLLVAPPILAVIAAGCVIAFARSSDVFRSDEAAIALLSAASFVAATVVPLTVLRAQQRLRGFLILTAVTGIVTTVLTLIAVVGLDLGLVGWFGAAIIANLVVLATAIRVMPWTRLDHFDGHHVRAALRLGISLVPHALSLWALSLANRIVLADLVTPTELGVYTLAANLAIPAMVVIQSMNQGFLPSYARAQDPALLGDLRQVVSLQALMVAAVSLGVAVIAAPIIGLLDDVYGAALPIVPWLVLGAFFWGLYQLPMNMISMVAGRTQHVWMIGLASAAVGIGSLYLLVPRYGLSAAGPASAIGYLALLLFTMVYLRALKVSLPVQRRQVGTGFGIALVTYALATLIPEYGIEALVARLALVLGATVAIAVVGGLRGRHLRAITQKLAKQLV